MLTSAIVGLTVIAVAAKSAALVKRGVRVSAYQRCLDKSQYLYTSDIRDCTGLEYQRAEILLDNAFRKAMAGLPPDRKMELKQSQARWQKRITIECDSDPEIVLAEGGTIWPILYTECFIAKIKDRTKWLKWNYAIKS